MTKVGTASKIAKLASKILDNPKSGKDVKAVAASAMTQSKNASEKTSKRVATIASKILRDDRFGKDAKKVAGSVLGQKE